MDYFWIRQNREYLNTPVIEGFYQTMRRKDFRPETAFKIPEKNVVFCSSRKSLDFLDILDGQVFLVSGMVKRVFEMYERGMSYKFFCCLNNVTGEYGTYYAPMIPFIDCLAKGRAEKGRTAIWQERITDRAVFRAENPLQEMVMIRLDVAESLLRRRPKGIELERIILV